MRGWDGEDGQAVGQRGLHPRRQFGCRFGVLLHRAGQQRLGFRPIRRGEDGPDSGPQRQRTTPDAAQRRGRSVGGETDSAAMGHRRNRPRGPPIDPYAHHW